MERIFLVQAGKFLLGIDAAAILASHTASEYTAGRQGHIPLLHLEAFLGQQTLAAVAAEVVELEDDFELPALLVDRIIGEVNAPNRFEPLPPLYPVLTELCCPQIFLYEEHVFLLLEPGKIEQVCDQLQTEHGFIALGELVSRAEQSVAEERVLQVPVVEEAVAPPVAEEQEEDVDQPVDLPDGQPEEEDEVVEALAPVAEEVVPPAMVDDVEDVAEPVDVPVALPEEKEELEENQTPVDEKVTQPDIVAEKAEAAAPPAAAEEVPAPENSDKDGDARKTEKMTGEINDEAFQKIVSWTIGQYIMCDRNEKAVINASDLPVGLIQEQGFSLTNGRLPSETIQYIINKTIVKCERLNDKSAEMLRKKYGNKIS